MRLTSYTDYSIRVLLYLNIHDNQLSTIQDIAEAYGISKNHLMKIIYNLGKLGYIETIRGRNGGIRLAKSPSEINIGKLVRETEEDFNIVECFSKDHNTCPITSICTLKGVLNQAMFAFLKVLDDYTLEDIAKNKIKLRALFDQHTDEK
ncbi:Rrf2 family transcriptional regulator [Bacillus massiliigorillae]|uniref:Rrf2 family transcriptional regulator n=1 Tax=Bacillus massiliigorillae TaxID=1243664 RepID=UPI0003A2BF13|nr:Rrf2 family transcriptional regulator [Bacillus massiliigorillae]